MTSASSIVEVRVIECHGGLVILLSCHSSCFSRTPGRPLPVDSKEGFSLGENQGDELGLDCTINENERKRSNAC